jgi:hypothetical protein
MKRRGLQLSRRHRWSLYAVVLVLFLSGVIWIGLHQLDEAGNTSGPWRELKPSVMTVHGLVAAMFVVLLGTLLPVHVRHSWHARRNRANGVFFLSVVSTLTLTGYLLYYLGNERTRAWCSNVHFWLGAAIPLLLVLHIWSGRRSTGNALTKSP